MEVIGQPPQIKNGETNKFPGEDLKGARTTRRQGSGVNYSVSVPINNQPNEDRWSIARIRSMLGIGAKKAGLDVGQDNLVKELKQTDERIKKEAKLLAERYGIKGDLKKTGGEKVLERIGYKDGSFGVSANFNKADLKIKEARIKDSLWSLSVDKSDVERFISRIGETVSEKARGLNVDKTRILDVFGIVPLDKIDRQKYAKKCFVKDINMESLLADENAILSDVVNLRIKNGELVPVEFYLSSNVWHKEADDDFIKNCREDILQIAKNRARELSTTIEGVLEVIGIPLEELKSPEYFEKVIRRDEELNPGEEGKKATQPEILQHKYMVADAIGKVKQNKEGKLVKSSAPILSERAKKALTVGGAAGLLAFTPISDVISGVSMGHDWGDIVKTPEDKIRVGILSEGYGFDLYDQDFKTIINSLISGNAGLDNPEYKEALNNQVKADAQNYREYMLELFDKEWNKLINDPSKNIDDPRIFVTPDVAEVVDLIRVSIQEQKLTGDLEMHGFRIEDISAKNLKELPVDLRLKIMKAVYKHIIDKTGYSLDEIRFISPKHFNVYFFNDQFLDVPLNRYNTSTNIPIEHYKTPRDFMEDGRGDCTDYAITVTSSAKTLGFESFVEEGDYIDKSLPEGAWSGSTIHYWSTLRINGEKKIVDADLADRDFAPEKNFLRDYDGEYKPSGMKFDDKTVDNFIKYEYDFTRYKEKFEEILDRTIKYDFTLGKLHEALITIWNYKDVIGKDAFDRLMDLRMKAESALRIESFGRYIRSLNDRSIYEPALHRKELDPVLWAKPAQTVIISESELKEKEFVILNRTEVLSLGERKEEITRGVHPDTLKWITLKGKIIYEDSSGIYYLKKSDYKEYVEQNSFESTKS